MFDRLIVREANLSHRNKKEKKLWSAVDSYLYRKSLEPNFQCISDTKEYDKISRLFVNTTPDSEGTLRIMREKLIKKGDIIE